MKKIIIALIIVLTGCAAPVSKHGASNQEIINDRNVCGYEARQYAMQMGVAGNPMVINDAFVQCLRMRGWG